MKVGATFSVREWRQGSAMLRASQDGKDAAGAEARRARLAARAVPRSGGDRIKGQLDDLPVTTYKRAAYEALRDMIVELEIPPGARLVESDLAARLRVSKTPIREAIALLESDGLVDVAPYRGATVRWLSTLEIEEQR